MADSTLPMSDRRMVEPYAASLQRLGRAILVAIMGGIIAGILAAGIGSRIAMRLVALAGGDVIAGRLTENGNLIGEITLGGTLFLIVSGGVSAGIIGGLLYTAIQRWLPGPERWRGLIFGLYTLLVLGSVLVDSGNPDFKEVGNPVLSIVFFALLFPLFGLVVAPAVVGMERLLPRVGGARLRPALAVGYVLAPATLLLLGFGIGGMRGLPIAVLVIAGISVWPRLAAKFPRPLLRLSSRQAQVVRYAALGIPAVIGAILLVREIVAIA